MMPILIDDNWQLIAGVANSKSIRVHESLPDMSPNALHRYKLSNDVNVVLEKLKDMFSWNVMNVYPGCKLKQQTNLKSSGYYVIANMKRHYNLWTPYDLEHQDVMRCLLLKELRGRLIFSHCPFNILNDKEKGIFN